MSDPRFEPENPFTEADIKKIEETIGRKLPQTYCNFVKKYGSAFVGGLANGSKKFPIQGFLGPDDEDGVLSDDGEFAELRAEGVLPIAECDFGNLYVMDFEDTNAVHYINYYGKKTKVNKVANSFQEFIDGIVPETDEDLEQDEEEEADDEDEEDLEEDDDVKDKDQK